MLLHTVWACRWMLTQNQNALGKLTWTAYMDPGHRSLYDVQGPWNKNPVKLLVDSEREFDLPRNSQNTAWEKYRSSR